MQAVVGSALLVGIKGFSVWGCGVELGGGGLSPIGMALTNIWGLRG